MMVTMMVTKEILGKWGFGNKEGYQKDLWWWPIVKSHIASIWFCTLGDFGLSIWGFWNGREKVWWVRYRGGGPIFWRGIFIPIIKWYFFKASRYKITAMMLGISVIIYQTMLKQAFSNDGASKNCHGLKNTTLKNDPSNKRHRISYCNINNDTFEKHQGIKCHYFQFL